MGSLEVLQIYANVKLQPGLKDLFNTMLHSKCLQDASANIISPENGRESHCFQYLPIEEASDLSVNTREGLRSGPMR